MTTTFDKYQQAGAYHWRQASRGWWNREFNPLLVARYAALLRLVPAKTRRLLDVGCGDGYLMHLLLDGQGRTIYGVDTDRTGVRLAQQQLARHHPQRWSVLVASADRLPVSDAAFDIVTLADVIEHLEQPEAILVEVARALRPGGALLISTPNRQPNHVWDPRHVQEFTPDTLRMLLEPHFAEVTLTACWPMRWFTRWKAGPWWRRLIVGLARLGRNPFAESTDHPSLGYGQLLAVCRR